jgi:hypothetical protein
MDRAKTAKTAISYADAREKLRAVEPLASELICDEEIATAANYKKPRYFLDSYYTLGSTTSVSSGVVSQQGSYAHSYQFGGRTWTHPNSAAAVGEAARAAKSDQVPGWRKKPTDQSGG